MRSDRANYRHERLVGCIRDGRLPGSAINDVKREQFDIRAVKVVKGEIISAVDALISPNPSKGSFNVDVKGFNTSTVDVKIAGLNSGKIYYAGKVANNSTTKITISVPNGNYAIELTDGKNIISRKVSILN